MQRPRSTDTEREPPPRFAAPAAVQRAPACDRAGGLRIHSLEQIEDRLDRSCNPYWAILREDPAARAIFTTRVRDLARPEVVETVLGAVSDAIDRGRLRLAPDDLTSVELTAHGGYLWTTSTSDLDLMLRVERPIRRVLYFSVVLESREIPVELLVVGGGRSPLAVADHVAQGIVLAGEAKRGPVVPALLAHLNGVRLLHESIRRYRRRSLDARKLLKRALHVRFMLQDLLAHHERPAEGDASAFCGRSAEVAYLEAFRENDDFQSLLARLPGGLVDEYAAVLRRRCLRAMRVRLGAARTGRRRR